MKQFLSHRPSPAMAVAFVALLVALTGTGYAAGILAPHSVGTLELKTDAVTPSKIKAGAVRRSEIATDAVGRSEVRNNAVGSNEVRDGSLFAVDFARGQLPQGAAGPKGDTGPQGPKGDTGPGGANGTNGLSALNTLPSGRTEHGVIGGDFHDPGSASGADFGVDVTLPIPAPAGLADSDVFVDVTSWQDAGGQSAPTTTDTDPGCTGTPTAPTAPAGKVCIYVSGADNAFNLNGYSALFGTDASPYGFKLKWDAPSTADVDTFVDAAWAYTAP